MGLMGSSVGQLTDEERAAFEGRGLLSRHEPGSGHLEGCRRVYLDVDSPNLALLDCEDGCPDLVAWHERIRAAAKRV